LVGDEYEYLSLMKFDLFGNKLDWEFINRSGV
jgi:hypothetical protein